MDKLTLLSGYAAVIYVDGTMGNDTTGNGTEALAYKTILKASQSVTMDDTMIYVAKEGIYEEDNIHTIINIKFRVTFSTVTVTNSDKKVFLRFTVSDGTAGYASVMTSENTFIGFIIQRVSNYGYYVWWRNGGEINLSFLNCVFDKTPHNPNIYPIRTGYTSGGVTPIKLEYVNCTFLPENFSAINTPISGQYRGDFIRCAIADSNLTPTLGNVLSGIFNANYQLISSSDLVGVYEGAYAWELDDAKTLIHNDGKYKKYINGQWVDVSSVPPTEQEFITHGMDITYMRNDLKRKLVTLSDGMSNQGVLGSGRLFKAPINLDRYFDIKKIEIK